MCQFVDDGDSIGSSPLARGTRRSSPAPCPSPRFIPAGAGNTRELISTNNKVTVHPRWRGEHAIAARCAAGAGRFIPAGAGNTADGRPARCRSAVHPRWRGEHAGYRRRRRSQNGSSPLARGTLCNLPVSLRLARFIPAGAGNTTDVAEPISTGTVHPRWRGEHHVVQRLGKVSSGSSPLARGTLRGWLLHESC